MSIDWFHKTAIRVCGLPDGWQWCKLDGHNMPEDFIQITGGVPTKVFVRGPRKGKPKWSGVTLATYWIRRADVEETKRLWEAESGKCANCEGDGKETASVSVNGKTFRTCSRCNGSGTPGDDA